MVDASQLLELRNDLPPQRGFAAAKNLLELRAVEIAVLERYAREKRRGAGVGRLNRLLIFGHYGYRRLRSRRSAIFHKFGGM